MHYRKNVRNLTSQEREDFVKAVKQLKTDGEYDRYITQHMEAMRHNGDHGHGLTHRNVAHMGPAFLPWHREFIRRFEADLQRKVPDMTLPYWDWTQDAALWDDSKTDEENIAFIEENSPVFAADFMGGNGDPNDNYYVKTGPFAYNPSDPETWVTVDPAGNPLELGRSSSLTGPGLQRAFGAQKPRHGSTIPGEVMRLPTSDDIGDPTDARDGAIQDIAPYDNAPWNPTSSPSYRNALEGWLPLNGKQPPNTHNRVHVWVDGDMAPMTSPNDPLFFLHHCFVDKVWADWQQAHPDERYLPEPDTGGNAAGHELDDRLFPWSTTPADVLNHHDLGYTYDTEVA